VEAQEQNTDSQSQPAQQTGSQPVAEPKPESEPQAAQKPEPQPESQPESQPEPQPVLQPEPKKETRFNYVGFLENIRPMILQKLEDQYPKLKNYSDYYLFIYINDKDAYQAARIYDMESSITVYIDSTRGKQFKAVQIHTGALQPGLMSAKVNDTVTIAVSNGVATPPPPQKIASLVLMHEETSVCTIGEGHFVLDPLVDTSWNIGWGKNTIVNGRPRINHIAFDYKNPDKQDAKVFMISRSHAHIKFINGNFFLYVEERGTRQAGKRTKIERGNQIIELTDINVGRCLKDGDVIRLNGEYLQFTYK